MKVLLFGATGMIGGGALLECLADDRVSSVLAIVRSPLGVFHPKLEELQHQDYLRFSPLQGHLIGYDACFFCLGVSAVGVDEVTYTLITYEVTLAATHAFQAANPIGTFCYISGAGTDSTEHGARMWARVKGRTENALLALGRTYMFRPGFIQPVKGVYSKTAWYNLLYSLLAPVSPVLRRWCPGAATTTAALGRALSSYDPRYQPFGHHSLTTAHLGRREIS